MALENRKILFFAPSFFGYEYAIKNKLEELGASVDLYDERPSSNSVIKALIRSHNRFLTFLITPLIRRYFNKIINENNNKNYDYIFIIKGEVFNPEIVLTFKQSFPNAKLILYLWDSIAIYKSIQDSLHIFDSAFTFDSVDSLKYTKLNFRPLFYIDKYSDLTDQQGFDVDYRFDILFIGTAHSDRWIFLNKIKEQALQKKLKVDYYLYIQSPLVFFVRKLFDKRLNGLSLKDVHFTSISQVEIIKRTFYSRSIIDIQHPKQTGMTMRTIEVLGAQRKLITTNQIIRDYDFYNPMNIMIIDRFNPIISEEFFEKKYIIPKEAIKNKYSLSGWINDIFDL